MAKTASKAPVKSVNAAVNKPNMSRKEIDAFMQARLMQQAASQPVQQPQQAANPYDSGITNLINLLMGRSPLQKDSMWGKR